ncbi:Ig-like domain-containing protein [uncultured Photobacterium sp.]|uniref:Ig-like domain-containing protein n=1 Tax=uncultured Photobacterium sp. TaxID=173973 RepID=UPI00262137E1|nr:Ig-like domain-containing protein [uncultured Photobacterium sp.]
MRKIIVLCSLFIFGCNGGSSSEAPHAPALNENTQQQTTTTEKEISSIHITYSLINGTSEPKISVQSTLQFTATAYFEDHSKRDISEQVQWISSDQRTGTVTNAGQFKGINAGTTAIMAQFNGIESNAIDVTVTDAEIRHVQIAPKSGNANNLPEGVTLEMVVTGIFSDNTHQELQRDALQWSSSNGAVARRIQPGIVKGINKGSAKITAQFNGITSNTVEVTVTDAVVNEIQITSKSGDLNIPAGFTQPITVSGLFSDNIKRKLSASDVTWSTANPSVATVDSDGIVKGISEGSTTISAQYNGFEGNPIESDPLTVTITDATLAEITITSSVGDVHNVVKGYNLQLVATGIFSDGSRRNISDDVSWSSDDDSFAMVDDSHSGLVHGVEIGHAVISAEFDDKKTDFNLDIDDVPPSFYVAMSKSYLPSYEHEFIKNSGEITYDGYVHLSLSGSGNDIISSVENDDPVRKQVDKKSEDILVTRDDKNNVIGFAGYVNVLVTSKLRHFDDKAYTTFISGYNTLHDRQLNKTYHGDIFYIPAVKTGDDQPRAEKSNISIQFDAPSSVCLITGYKELTCDNLVTDENGVFSYILTDIDGLRYGDLKIHFFGENGEFATGYIFNDVPGKLEILSLSSK